MEKEKFQNLCSHYKDTYDVHRSSLKQRDDLFYKLLIVVAIFTLQLSRSNPISAAAEQYVFKLVGIHLENAPEFIATAIWLALLGLSLRYFTVVLEIERQYDYLHALEGDLSGFYPGSVAFTREGRSYFRGYPLFSNFMAVLYTLAFPLALLGVVAFSTYTEVCAKKMLDFNVVLDCLSAAVIIVSTLLYMYRLHNKALIGISGIWNVVSHLGKRSGQRPTP